MKSVQLLLAIFFLQNFFFSSSLSIETTQKPQQKTYSVSINKLPNLGNNCYMNAALQCLFQIPEIATFIHTSKNKKQNNFFLYQCKKILDAFEKNDIKRVRKKINKLFNQVDQYFFDGDKQQQDVLEFITQLIDNYQLLQPLFSLSLNTSIVCTQCNELIQSANQTIYDVSLHDLEPTAIDNILCHQCCFCVKAHKTSRFNNHPPYLLIDCQSDFLQLPIAGYQLIGIVLHAGTNKIGHYIAFVKESSTKKWYLCDDMCVFKLGNNIEKKKTYLIPKENQLIPFCPRMLLYAKQH
ncbi:hypothetical protein KAH94_05690 [bacterium]|nr:hypothetical protein [bacterium]